MKNRLYVDFHIIQTVPPSCVNRDDTNSPKTAIYGGIRRARISSQAWKKATRDMFREQGMRTKKIQKVVAEDIISLKPVISIEDANKAAEKIIKAANISLNEKTGETGALFFISPKQSFELASLAVNDNFDKKAAQTALNSNPTIDIALFGRMVADDPTLNIDACCQVAHAISTHRTETEFDFFTAIDDCSPGDNAGAGMMGTVEFNSSTFYRYATIAVHDLKVQLGSEEAAADAVKEFARAFITSMPTGKQNTFANRTLPDYVLVTIRCDQPVNLVGAFESAVKGINGYVEQSIEKLTSYAKTVYDNYSGNPKQSYKIGDGLNLPGLLEKLREDVRYDLIN
jgi:CRISPR system Cascade subunit CasC